MVDTPERGYASSKPVLYINPKTGKLEPMVIPEDAIMIQAKPGYKSGSRLLDEINEDLRKQGLIVEKIKEFYKIGEEEEEIKD